MFERGLTVFRFRGIPVKLHFTLLLFLPFVAFIAARQFTLIAQALGVPPEQVSVPPLVWGALLAVGLFVAILLHEMAHTVVALQSGGSVKAIVLMMLGGVSQIDKEVRPEREAWMAFAGPLASFAIAAVAYLVYRVIPLPAEVAVTVAVFALMNGIIAVFNLLPAFPMDGGRILRGLLQMRMSRIRATRIASGLGKIMAVAFGLLGLLSFNIILILIAFFIYMGASGERQRLEAHDVLKGIPVTYFMSDRIGEAYTEESSGDVARRLLQQNLVGARVVDAFSGDPLHHKTLGVVTVWDLAQRAARGAPDVPVREAMRTNLPTVHSEDDGAGTLDALAGANASAVVVVDAADEVIGLVTAADIQRAIALSSIAGRPDK